MSKRVKYLPIQTDTRKTGKLLGRVLDEGLIQIIPILCILRNERPTKLHCATPRNIEILGMGRNNQTDQPRRYTNLMQCCFYESCKTILVKHPKCSDTRYVLKITPMFKINATKTLLQRAYSVSSGHLQFTHEISFIQYL